jgi:hypothetical protein
MEIIFFSDSRRHSKGMILYEMSSIYHWPFSFPWLSRKNHRFGSACAHRNAHPIAIAVRATLSFQCQRG